MANDRDLRHDQFPEGLLEALTDEDPEAGSERMSVAREHADSRTFDEPAIVREIACQLLAIS